MLSSAPPCALRGGDHARPRGRALFGILLEHRVGGGKLLKNAGRLATMLLNVGSAQFFHNTNPTFSPFYTISQNNAPSQAILRLFVRFWEQSVQFQRFFV